MGMKGAYPKKGSTVKKKPAKKGKKKPSSGYQPWTMAQIIIKGNIMASRTPGKTTQGKIGDMKVEETTMMPNVPNQERQRADDVINFEGLPSKNAKEIAQEIVISHNPKRPKK